MRFKFLTGDINWKQYGGKFISNRQNNGDWDYWLVIEAINVEDYSDIEEKYIVEVSAVSPTAAKNELKNAFNSCGLEITDDELIQVEVLSSYGVEATLWNSQGNNINKMMKDARAQAKLIELFFGFYMDRPLNLIGNDGWDFISGNIGVK